MFYAITVFGRRPTGLPRYTHTEAAARLAIQRADEREPSACVRAGVQIRKVTTRQRALTLSPGSPFLPGEGTV